MAPLDVLAIGNALVDVLATVSDQELAALGIAKHSYELLDEEGAERVYAAMPPATISMSL